jgi:hypothetical protein
MAVQDPTVRAWKATRTAEAGVFINQDKAIVAGDSKHFMVADKNGLTFKGPTNMVSMSTEQRTGGLFLGLGEFSEMIPSTIVTPLPSKIPVPPITAIINVIGDVAFFAAILV